MDTVRAETQSIANPTAPLSAGAPGDNLARPVLETLAAGFTGARIHVACEPCLRLPATELALVSQMAGEAISNALQHAFPEGRDGDIWLRLGEAGGRITLMVRDNGIGMPDLQHGGSSGSGRIEALAQQLGGFARLGSANFGGAEVLVVFPRGH